MLKSPTAKSRRRFQEVVYNQSLTCHAPNDVSRYLRQNRLYLHQNRSHLHQNGPDLRQNGLDLHQNQTTPSPERDRPVPNRATPELEWDRPVPNRATPVPERVRPAPNQTTLTPNQITLMPNQPTPAPNRATSRLDQGLKFAFGERGWAVFIIGTKLLILWVESVKIIQWV